MTISFKHHTQATVADGGTGEIGKVAWNEEHDLLMASDSLLGRASPGSGAVEEIPITSSARSLISSHLHSSLSSYREFATGPDVVADSNLTYATGSANTVAVGDYIRTRDYGHAYQVLDAAAVSYHIETPNGVRLNVLPGPRGYNVRAFGAKGDGATNDTTAITAAVTAGWTDSVPIYFPAGTFMCNLDLSGSNATLTGKVEWNGAGRSLTILKAYDNTQNTVRFTTTDNPSHFKFFGIRFHGNSGTANHAFRINNAHYCIYEDCQFTNAWMGFRHEGSWGSSFKNCMFGSACSYGYYGIGSSGAHCGYHSFSNACRFRGSKIAYIVDNLSAPSGDGPGNLHDLSEFEQITGLPYFIRNQSARPEQWRNVWFEGNATSGTVDPSDLPSPSSTIGTLTIPVSGVIIHSGTASSTTYKKTRLIVDGGFVGADVLNDCDIIADRISGAVTKLSGNTEAVITVKQRLFDVFAPATTYGVIDAVTDRIDYFNALANAGAYTSQSIGALGVPKTSLDYNPSQINRLVGANIDAAGVSGGFVFSSAGTVALDYTRGGMMGRSYAITIANGESVDLVGTGSSGSVVGYNAPMGVSFAIMHATTGDMSLDIERVILPSSRSTFGAVTVRNEWKTYNFFTGAQLCRFAIKNNTGASVTFYLTDLQGIGGLGGSGTRAQNHALVVNHLASNKLAAATSTIPIFVGRPAPYILAQSNAAVSVGAVTTETVLATITVPAGALGANGSVEILTQWTTTNNVNNKTLIVRAGGTSGTQYVNVVNTTSNGLTRYCIIANNNSASSQKSIIPAGNVYGIGTSASAAVTSSVNTANNWDIVIAGTKANSADTLTLESYSVIINYSA